MFKKMISGLVFAASVFAVTPSFSQSILESCQADIAAHCAMVQPGDGRLSACLYAHEDSLSYECDAATEAVSNMLDMFFSKVREIGIACGEDVHNHCADVEIGQGRMMKCLRDNRAAIKPACAAALDSVPTPDS